MKKKSVLIILFVYVFLIVIVVCFVKNYNIKRIEILNDEENQVSTLKDIYTDFFQEFKIYDDGNILLDETCLTNIISGVKFSDDNIEKLKELEKESAENIFVYTLYLEYDKDTGILTLTLKEKSGIQEQRIRYKLYVKENSIKYEVYGLVESWSMTPSE